MKRKWTVLAATLAASALAVAALAAASPQEEETPLGKVMEKVQKNHTGIMKAYRTQVAWSKGQKDVANMANDMVKLAKEARPLNDVVKQKKQTVADWNERMDAFIKEAESFAKVAAKPGLKNTEAKKAYLKVSASCTNCHNVYRDEE